MSTCWRSLLPPLPSLCIYMCGENGQVVVGDVGMSSGLALKCTETDRGKSDICPIWEYY